MSEVEWVIEQFQRRAVAVDLQTARVDIHGSWVYHAVGLKEMRMSRFIEPDMKPPRIRLGQRFSMESAISKVSRLRQLLPGITFRVRNVNTNDVIMADIL